MLKKKAHGIVAGRAKECALNSEIASHKRTAISVSASWCKPCKSFARGLLEFRNRYFERFKLVCKKFVFSAGAPATVGERMGTGGERGSVVCTILVINHSMVAERAWAPDSSWSSTFTEISPRPLPANAARSSSNAPSVTVAAEVVTPFAGLRNFASNRRTTGTIPSVPPSKRSRNSPLLASANARSALAWTVPRWFRYCPPEGSRSKCA